MTTTRPITDSTPLSSAGLRTTSAEDPSRATLVLDRRLQGPRRRANGGVISGAVATFVGGTAQVRLHRPVRLATALDVVHDRTEVTVTHRRATVATGRAVDPFVVEPPVRPTIAQAHRASDAHPLRGERHLLSDCVVCSPGRTDGLGVVWGPLEGHPDVLAAPFVPSARDASDEVVHAHTVWGALDCPGYPVELLRERRIALLGTLAVHRRRQVRVGERLVVVGWTLAHRGRAHDTATALLDAEGEVVASGLATWVELRHQRRAHVAGRLL